MYSSISNKQNPSELSSNHVNIYLRNYKKQAILVTVPIIVSCSDLRNYVANRFATSQDKLALFYNGIRIDLLLTENLELKDKSIVHVVQLERTKRQEMTIFFKFPKKQGEILKVKTSSNAYIRSVFQSYVIPYFGKSEKQVFFAYLGKPLNIFKTFEEELIEDECQLMILQFKKVQKKQFEVVDLSGQVNNKSFASTKMVGMPMMGGGSLGALGKQKQKDKQKNKSKLNPQSSIQQQSAPPLLVPAPHESSHIKNQNHYIKEQSAAPPHEIPLASKENAAPPAYFGFDPHGPSAAPPKDKSFEEKPQKTSKGPFKKLDHSQQSNPEQENFKIKQNDLLFVGYTHMQETQNFTAGVVQEYRESFLKKKSSSGKQNNK